MPRSVRPGEAAILIREGAAPLRRNLLLYIFNQIYFADCFENVLTADKYDINQWLFRGNVQLKGDANLPLITIHYKTERLFL